VPVQGIPGKESCRRPIGKHLLATLRQREWLSFPLTVRWNHVAREIHGRRLMFSLRVDGLLIARATHFALDPRKRFPQFRVSVVVGLPLFCNTVCWSCPFFPGDKLRQPELMSETRRSFVAGRRSELSGCNAKGWGQSEEMNRAG